MLHDTTGTVCAWTAKGLRSAATAHPRPREWAIDILKPFIAFLFEINLFNMDMHRSRAKSQRKQGNVKHLHAGAWLTFFMKRLASVEAIDGAQGVGCNETAATPQRGAQVRGGGGASCH
ncbi:hypothetical protein [Comamonas sp.]|uniref:hypothetical protein n=1 Tax=Comamonas sp. TaxID=34028 RepID=UPI00289CF4A5|nr:hypothetical protein [Comamonas sp.]